MEETNVFYIPVTPVCPTPNTLKNIVDTEPDAIVIGCYDSGKLRKDLLSEIQNATEKGIAVFGVRETLFIDTRLDLSEGSPLLDELYEMDPETLRTGLIPLQVYPQRLCELEKKIGKLLGKYQEFSDKHVTVKHNGLETLEYVMHGLKEICAKHTSYKKRVKEARKKFSSSEFNARIDEITKTGIVYRAVSKLKNLFRSNLPHYTVNNSTKNPDQRI